ncbi:MAG: type II toxin-antitoxin system RelE/ParE family toxin [Armatimonadetes bacterium]|nr:type II toxin-antitoxin system RelE/ParE family toxin [Armatimonadota bacterium]
MSAADLERGDKPLYWVASSKKDLKAFPEDVVDVMGFGLRLVQKGGTLDNAKPLKGFDGAGVCEIIENYDTDTYRAVYTVRFPNAVYVLHAFKKKAHHGIKTPKKELDVIKLRLKYVEEDYAARYLTEKNAR